MAIKIALYYQTPENCEYLKRIISSSPESVLVEARTLDKLPSQVNSGANVIFLEYQETPIDLDSWIKKTCADPGNPPIFLYFQEITTDQLWKALRLGVKECFVFPIRTEEYLEALERLPAPVMPAAGLTEATRVISFLGCKGGVGTTFLSVNVAYQLAQEKRRPVLLIDLDLRYGQMVHFLDAKPRYSISDVIENLDHLDVSYLESLLHQYDKDLLLLAAPPRLEEAEQITADNFEKVLRRIKDFHLFTHVVVDAGHQVEEINLRALELSDKIVLVASQSIPALSNARKILELFQLIGLDQVEWEVWLNAWQKHGDLKCADVSSFLGRPVKATLPFDSEAIAQSINEGHPLAKVAPKNPVCRELLQLTHTLGGITPANNNGSRWNLLKFLKRSK